MIYRKWKFAAGLAVLVVALGLAPAALSGFSANTTFTTQAPVQEQSSGDPFVIQDGMFTSSSSAGDDAPLGSNTLGNYRLNFDGSVYEVGGLGDTVRSASGNYSIDRDDNGEATPVSSGTFEVQTTSSLLDDSVMVNAMLSEQAAAAGYEGLASDGLMTLSGVGNGRDFSALLQAGGISSDPLLRDRDNDRSELDLEEMLGQLGGLEDGTCAALLKAMLCEHSGNGFGGTDASVIPEPTSMALLGLLGVAAMARRGRGRRRPNA